MVTLDKVQRYLANAGITQSAVRLGKAGKDVRGMAQAASAYCSEIQLDRLASAADYPAMLDRWTDDLVARFPAGGQFWGTARKCINIFMRDATYNTYLRKAHGLAKLEGALEVPLDRDVARGLLGETEGWDLPPWVAIYSIPKPDHAKYQETASRVAARRGLHRVHLDLFYWRAE